MQGRRNGLSQARRVLLMVIPMLMAMGERQTFAAGGFEQWRQQWKGESTTGAVEQLSVTAAGVDRYGDIYTLARGQLAKYLGASGAGRWTLIEVDRGGNYRFEGLAMKVDPNGFLLVAKAYSTGVRVAKHAASNGDLVWEHEFRHAGGLSDWVNSISIDSQGNVLAAGYTELTRGQIATVMKFAAADGRILWEQTHQSTGGFAEFRAVRTDRDGNVGVTGFTYDPLGNGDLFVAKYRSDDGALEWERRYREPGTDANYGLFLESDSAGHWIAAGYSEFRLANRDFLTLKYDGRDGTLLWHSRFNGTGGGGDQIRAMGLDGQGDVAVTGGSWEGPESAFDFRTILYSGTDGAIVWSQLYGGPSNSSGESRGLAADRNGRVYVSGRMWVGDGLDDCIAVAYAPDGRSEWTNRFVFSPPADALPTSSLVGAGGTVFCLYSGLGTDDVIRQWAVKFSPSISLGERLAATLVQRDFYHPVRTNEVVPFDQYLLSTDIMTSDREIGCYLRDVGTGFIPEVGLIGLETGRPGPTVRASGTGGGALLLITNLGPERQALLVSGVESTGVGPYQLGVYGVVRPGQTLAAELSTSDWWSSNRTAALGNGRWYYDEYLLQGVKLGDRISITVNGAAFVPFIEARLLADETVQSYAEGGSHLWAVQGTAEGTRDYLIRVTSTASESVGAYSLQVQRAALVPQIWSFSPTVGWPGSWLTVRGTNFLDGPNPNLSGVLIGGTNAPSLEPIRGDLDEEFTAMVPLGARSGPIEVLQQQQVVATSTNYFTVLAPVGGARREPGGRLSFAVTNLAPDAAYVVEATESLNAPIIWGPVQTNRAAVPGVWRYTNAIGGSQIQSYYRVKVQ